MGFRLSEYVVKGDSLEMIFLQRKGNPHDIVFANSSGPRLHHCAYQVPETHHLMHVCDLFVVGDKEGQVEFGPARHFSPGLARFLYLRDPDGHRIELFPSHYHTVDIEDEPLEWEAPEFKIGGWTEPPDRWWNDTTAFRRHWPLIPEPHPMRIVTFSRQGGVHHGVRTGERITVHPTATSATDLAMDAAAHPAGEEVALSEVALLAPVPRPGKVICIGLNYRDHAAEGGNPIPDYPAVFLRGATSLVGPGQPIIMPDCSDKLDFEAELGVVIGRTATNVRENPLDYVAGYCCFNDGTIRDYQRKSSQWTIGKNFDLTGALQRRAGHARRAPRRRRRAEDHLARQRRDHAGRRHRRHDLRRRHLGHGPVGGHDAGVRRRHRHGNPGRRRLCEEAPGLPARRR